MSTLDPQRQHIKNIVFRLLKEKLQEMGIDKSRYEISRYSDSLSRDILDKELGNADSRDENTEPIVNEFIEELRIAQSNSLKKTSKIKHLSNGKWRVTDESGKKNLGTSDSKAKAVKRLHQVEYFKNKKSEFVSKIMVVAGIENYTIKKIIVS